MVTIDEIDAYGAELYLALRGRHTVPPLSDRSPDLTVDDAYKISLGFLERRLADGERVVGKKIGLTSQVVQDMLKVHEPDFGFLTHAMERADGDTIEIARHMIQPRAEAEIAFVMKSALSGPGVGANDVLDATDYICPCFEIVNSRVADWRIKIADTIADNASCGLFVLSRARANPRDFDLAALRVKVRKNGAPLSEGLGAAVQGSPLAAVAWLANTLGPYGVELSAGDVVLSGSLVPLEPARPGDLFEMELEGIGGATVRFA